MYAKLYVKWSGESCQSELCRVCSVRIAFFLTKKLSPYLYIDVCGVTIDVIEFSRVRK